MDKQVCNCSNDATDVCNDHSLYLCAQHNKEHECKTIKLKTYINKVNWKEEDLVNSLKAIEFEHGKNKAALLDINKTMVQNLKSIKEDLNKGLDQLISTYEKKIEDVIENNSKCQSEGIKKTINRFNENNDYIKLNHFIDSLSYGKIRKTERDVSKTLSKLMDNDSVYNHIELFLNSVKNQVTSIKEVVGKVSYDDINNASKVKESCYHEIAEIIHKETKCFELKKESAKNEIEKSFIRTMVMKPETKKETETDNKEQMPLRIRHNSFRRGTALIENSLADKIKLMSQNLKKIETESEDESINSSSFENSEEEFEDFESDDDAESDNEEFKEEFNLSKEELKSLLKETIAEVEKEEFYNMEEKPKVTTYLNGLNKRLEEVLQRLILNFNKL